MGDETLDVELTAELDTARLSQLIGEQLIVGGDGGEFAYLAGIAFDGMHGHDDLVGILMEYMRNEKALDLREEEADQIEEILRAAYEAE